MTAWNRRDLFQIAGASAAAWAVGSAAAPASAAVGAEKPPAEPFDYCFNTSTIMGQKVPLPRIVEIVAKAGYRRFEPWLREIDAYVQSGGSLADLKKKIADLGLTVESSIGFATWIVDDDAARAKGLEQAKRDMDLVQQLGGKRMAAPPTGAVQQKGLDLLKAAERYRELCKLGESFGVTPQAEVWGFSTTLTRLGETAMVAIESGHPRACVLPDIYHLYKGGSAFGGVKLLSGTAVHVLHVNDYPNVEREKITDADRVYPGDGVAPIGQCLRDMYAAGFRGLLSLELFNREYWKQDPLEVARTGLEKTRAVVRKAFDG